MIFNKFQGLVCLCVKRKRKSDPIEKREKQQWRPGECVCDVRENNFVWK